LIYLESDSNSQDIESAKVTSIYKGVGEFVLPNVIEKVKMDLNYFIEFNVRPLFVI